MLSGRPPLSGLPDVPGADRPYPNLGTVPARPPRPSAEERRRVAEALVADRENARHVGLPRRPAAEAPPAVIAEPAGPLGFRAEAETIAGAVAPDPVVFASPPPSPIAGAPASLPPAAPSESAGRAVASPATLPPPPAPLPSGQATAPSPPPPPRIEPASPDPTAEPPRRPAAPAVVVPDVPRAAPAPVAPDPSVIVDRSALPPAVRTVPPRPTPASAGAAIAFPRGSALLPPGEREILLVLARTRGAAAMRIIGFLDAAGEDLGLALARAQAVAQALRAAGVPADAVEIAAEARPGPAGRGAEVRLIY
ncbi:MAG: hypothetical protein RML45_04315 [Acetobacteraceae bacterium]|nr:hypothetical protein [Acetobacteraceae bacterium]